MLLGEVILGLGWKISDRWSLNSLALSVSDIAKLPSFFLMGRLGLKFCTHFL